MVLGTLLILAKKTCTCCLWELVGIPCRHAIVAMSHEKLDPKTFVDKCYSKETYKLCYSYNVSPTNGMNMWSKADADDMLPPSFKKGPVKPKKSRFREHGGNGSRMIRPGIIYRCTKCDKYGHNIRKYQCKEQDIVAFKRNVCVT